MTDDNAATARAIIDANRYMTLGTADASGLPWVSPVWFATVDHRRFYWVSDPAARHSRNLAERPQLAIVIFDSTVVPGDAAPVYMSAVAEEVTGSELAEGLGIFKEVMNSSSALMYRARQVSNLGGFMSGVNNNGAHSANGITAMFIATGQDVANVAESSAAFTYAELRENGDYYYSLTIPSLIVGTYGGGTGLATQRECLELLDCYGKGKVQKFAEIVAATVLCGELSLGSAIVAEESVNAHDLHGRNRP